MTNPTTPPADDPFEKWLDAELPDWRNPAQRLVVAQLRKAWDAGLASRSVLPPWFSALEELEKKATPGPWQQSAFVDHARYNGMSAEWKDGQRRHEATVVRGPGRVGSGACNPVADVFLADDRAFVIALVNSFPQIREAVMASTALSALSASTPAGATPATVRVPVEPTRTMIEAGERALDMDSDIRTGYEKNDVCRIVWKAMLAACPGTTEGEKLAQRQVGKVEAEYQRAEDWHRVADARSVALVAAEQEVQRLRGLLRPCMCNCTYDENDRFIGLCAMHNAHMINAVESAASRAAAAEKDGERLDYFERDADAGGCASLLYDDNGHWAVVSEGTQTVPDGDGVQDIETCFWVEGAKWYDSPRAAIDAALAPSGPRDGEGG